MMFSSLEEIFGEKLVQYNESDGKSSEISTVELNGKSIAFYFSFVSRLSIYRQTMSQLSFVLVHIGVHHVVILLQY